LLADSHRPSPIAALIVAASAVFVAGCAPLEPRGAGVPATSPAPHESQSVATHASSTPNAPAGSDVSAGFRPGVLPDLAVQDGNALILRYRENGATALMSAHWPATPPGEHAHVYLTARLEPAEGALRIDTEPGAGRGAVTLLSRERWESTLRALFERLLPEDSSEVLLIAVQGRDVAVWRDAGAKLRVRLHEEKPAEVRVTRALGEEQFASLALEYLRSVHGEKARLLFDLGAADDGALLFFDLGGHQSVLVLREPDGAPGAISDPLGFALRLSDALVLRSHLLTPVLRPVSSLTRLLWLTTQTAAALLPRGAAEPDAPVPPVADRAPMDPQAWEARLDAVVPGSRHRGAIEPLIDGEAFFGALVQSIQDARDGIDIRLYIFDRDDYALRIAELLKRRSAQVRVRVVLDYLGTVFAAQVPSTPAYPYASTERVAGSILDFLRSDSRVEVRASTNPWLTSDHAKVILVDRSVAYVGGMNIGHEYRFSWHDMMVSLQGPVVGRLARDFEQRWAHAGLGGDFALAAVAAAEERFEGPAERDDYVDLRLLYTNTGDPQILRAQLAAMAQASRRIWVQQPYLSDDAMIAGLVAARRRGVDVRVVLPSQGDSGFMNGANLVAANALIRNGVRVYAFPGMTHVKAALYDGWACVGSANFDKLSLRVNLETDVATSDPRFVDRLERELFERDFARSREIREQRSVGWSAYLASFIANQL